MGAKFYRGADKPKKLRKRFSQTRSWFRTLKWVAYHAHPHMVAGHPFKGSWVFSTGQLLHPDLKRFSLQSAVLFKPPFPGKNPYDHVAVGALGVPSFSEFFSAYFGQQTLNISNDKCAKLFEGMKKVSMRFSYLLLLVLREQLKG
jgi:hypothetical protein